MLPTTGDGHLTLDEILENQTDLPITEHATDTHGATLVNSGLSDLAGKALTPRIRHLGRIAMLRVHNPGATNALHPHAGPLPADRRNEGLTTDCHRDPPRMGGSPKFGEATASPIVGKWPAASRRNTLAAPRPASCALRAARSATSRCRSSPPPPREHQLLGFITVDIEAELIEGRRPLRPTTDAGTSFLLGP
ncbi:Tn3 family transposase [Nonomuraea longicatena]|uniref:Tn3 family transposase n=1 Tax=Nonomuraea longicatena TaxID=83682 RepID=UPI003CD06DF9